MDRRIALLALAALAASWAPARRSVMRGPRMAAAGGDDDDDADPPEAAPDDEEEVITMESLPDALQRQIVEAISRSRAAPKKSKPGSEDDGQGAAIARLFAFADSDDDDEPFVVMGNGPGGMPGAPDRAAEKRAAKDEKATRSAALERIARFDLRPREVREHLDRYVVRQADAKKVLSVAICDHYNVVRRCLGDPAEKAAEYSKPNILLAGPSGSGKTYVMRTLARLLGVPFVIADATKFTETGIVGEDAEDLVRQLVEQADGDVELASYGIIYVDEVDKLCRGEQAPTVNGAGAPVGGGARGVQNTFLKVMEETDIAVNKQSSMIPEIFLGGKAPQPARVSTKHVLFIFSGAFTALDARLRKEAHPTTIGFGEVADDAVEDGDAESPPESFLKTATSSDFVAAGLETEFVGRIPVRVAVDPLGTRDLEEILLKSEGSVLRQYERDFRGYGVDLEVTRDAVAEIAKRASEEKTGARGLVTVLERTFRDVKYEVPCAGLSRFVCDAAAVADPASALAALLASTAQNRAAVRRADARRFEADFGFDHAPLAVALSAAAEDFLVAEAEADAERSLRGIATEKLLDDATLPAALKRIAKRTGETHFELSLDLVLDKSATLAALEADAERRFPEPIPADSSDAEDAGDGDGDGDDGDGDGDGEATDEDAAASLRRFLDSDKVLK